MVGPLAPLTGQDKKSLNKGQRKKDLLKITFENYKFLARLNEKQSNYNVTQWESQFKEKEKMMRSMSEFPSFYDKRD
jgi:hypothetical protein